MQFVHYAVVYVVLIVVNLGFRFIFRVYTVFGAGAVFDRYDLDSMVGVIGVRIFANFTRARSIVVIRGLVG